MNWLNLYIIFYPNNMSAISWYKYPKVGWRYEIEGGPNSPKTLHDIINMHLQ